MKKQIEVFLTLIVEEDCIDQTINKLEEQGNVMYVCVNNIGNHEIPAEDKAYALTCEERRQKEHGGVYAQA